MQFSKKVTAQFITVMVYFIFQPNITIFYYQKMYTLIQKV